MCAIRRDSGDSFRYKNGVEGQLSYLSNERAPDKIQVRSGVGRDDR